VYIPSRTYRLGIARLSIFITPHTSNLSFSLRINYFAVFLKMELKERTNRKRKARVVRKRNQRNQNKKVSTVSNKVHQFQTPELKVSQGAVCFLI